MSNDKRKFSRVRYDEDIMFARRSVHPFSYFGGTTINYSLGGMCFQSRYEVVPGDTLCLRMIGGHLQSFSSLDELTCMAEVKWCEPIGSPENPAFRIGLKYNGNLIPPLYIP